jgi:hypothetical protein
MNVGWRKVVASTHFFLIPGGGSEPDSDYESKIAEVDRFMTGV